MYHSVNKKEYIFRIIIKFIAVFASLFGMIKGFGGSSSLTYFTYQSNIFISLMLFIFMLLDLKILLTNHHQKEKPQWLYIIKFMATLSITVTLLVFAFILAPAFGSYYYAYFGMDGGVSFCLHLLTPLLAIFDFIFFDNYFKSKNSYALYALIPPLCYVAYVIVMGQCFNYRWGNMMAPYNFLNYGAPCGWFKIQLGTFGMDTVGIGVFYMIIVLLLFFALLGSLLLLINRKLHHN